MHYRILKPLLLLLPLLMYGCGGGSGGTASGTGPTPASTTFKLGSVALATAGANHTVAIVPQGAASGPAYAWGDNTWGQVGDGTLAGPKSTPVSLGTNSLWKSIAAGGYHTLAIKSDGTLWAWGLNVDGQLGDGTGGAGRYQLTPEQIGVAKDWLAVAAGDAHSIALEGTTSPQIMAWGQNASGQLGLGATLAASIFTNMNVPTKVTKAITVVNSNDVLGTSPYSGLPWTAISAGGSNSMAMRHDGTVFSWGDNTYGQLGQVIPVNVSVPTQLAPIGAGILGAIAIATGRYHSLAILSDHTLFAWGANASGQVGDGSTTNRAAAVQVGTDKNWYAVAAGGAHTLAIKQDRTLWAWGSNSDGQLGDGTTTDSVLPEQIGTATNWVAVAAGRSHSLAVAADGTLWVWGRNAEGQLGNGSATGPVLTPTLLP